MSVHVVIAPSGRAFTQQAGETVLAAGLRHGLALPYGCANGACGDCRARLLRGSVAPARHADFVIPRAEKDQNTVLMCAVTATTDAEFESHEAVGADDIPIREIDTRVRQVRELNENIAILDLRTPRSKSLRFLPGQYLRLQLDNGEERYKSIASCPCDGVNLRFHVRRVAGDPFSNTVFEDLRKGDSVHITGPYGGLPIDAEDTRPRIAAAYGTGFAPMVSLIEQVINLELEAPFHLYWYGERQADIYFDNLCRSWADAIEEFDYCLCRPGEFAGPVEMARRMHGEHPNLAASTLYLAAPPWFSGELRVALNGLGALPERVIEDCMPRID